MEWQELEQKVRLVASYLWDCDAQPETINGVKIDAVCKPKDDYFVLIEITQERTLEKLRTDLAKFASVRPYLLSQSVYSKCYFVSESKPPESLIETGRGLNIKVLSFDAFQKLLFDYSKYLYSRLSKPFGSAINPESGEKDDIKYVPVEYLDVRRNKEYRIEDIARLLMTGNRVILTGNYGTGKSRCIQELFTYFGTQKKKISTFPISIDLRDHWGTRRGPEIIRRHFDDLGLSRQADNVIKVQSKGGIMLLLDGFDEIASQTWSDDPTKLKQIRAKSLIGVQDLIKRNKSGVIITGRQNYFNSDDEMLQCLGLNPESTILMCCADEFTAEQMTHYLKNISVNLPLPKWLPRKPIICKVVSAIDPVTLDLLMTKPSGEVEFWEHFIRAICEREARIAPTLDSATIKNILCEVASITRTKPGDLGPLSTLEINQAFEKEVGTRPSDESAVILQRLPALGRVAVESPDRQFVDSYILDGLRAENLIHCVNKKTESVLSEIWLNPLRRFGLIVVADNIDFSDDETSYFVYMQKAAASRNHVLAGDILAALCLLSGIDKDFHHLSIRKGHISLLDLSGKKIRNLSIRDTVIEELDISKLQANNVEIRGCIIMRVYGVSSSRGLPLWISDNQIDKFQEISTVSSIKSAELSKSQKIFLTIIRKTFFQPGSGRKEEALLRGLGAQADSRIAKKIVNMLLAEGVLERIKGDEGFVYIPNRAYSKRMSEIRSQLTASKDPLWKRLDAIS